MPFAAALSTRPETTQALAEVCAQVKAGLSGAPDLAMLFFSIQHAPASRELARSAKQELAPGCLLGCVGESIVGNEREVEDQPALSLWAAKFTRPVRQEPFHLMLERTPDGPTLMGWPDAFLGADPKESTVLMLGDPYTFPIDFCFQRLQQDSPGLRVLGGMASGIRGAGDCRLVLDDVVHDQGAVGVVLHGPVGLRSIVSQGCRPIGRPYLITKAQDNFILELGGRPAIDQLRELWEGLTAQEQQLVQHGLHIGRVINEYQSDFQRGDFLVRNVIGLDRNRGAVVITDRVRVGQTIQFHVRDAQTADEDLHALLQLDLQAHDKQPAGALLFTCNGRGRRLFEVADHDASAIRTEAGPIPLAGFFAQGELGPVGGRNFIHGFTASVALFEEG
jgi:small ligand-binding sensory domain FIST